MLKNMGLASKLNLIIMTIVSLTISTVSYVAFLSAEKSLESARLEQLESIANLKVNTIQTFFTERKNDIKSAQSYFNIKSNLPIVSQYRQDRSHPNYQLAKKMLDGQLKVFQNVYKLIDIMLVNREGIIVYSSNEKHVELDLDSLLPDPGNKAFEEGKKNIYISEVFNNRVKLDRPEMIISAPIHNFQGEFSGVVAFEVDTAPIFDLIQDSTGLGETGETMIAKRVGNDALFLNPLRHESSIPLNRKHLIGEGKTFPMQKAVQGREGHGVSLDYRNKEVLAVWRYIPELEWGLVAKIDTEEAYASVSQLKWQIFFIASLIFIITSILVSWFSKTLSGPIIIIADTAAKIGEGDLTSRVKIDSNDEIGRLAGGINKMAQALSDTQETKLAGNLRHSEAQKKRLESQSEALKQSNSELQQFTYVVSHDLKAPFRAIHNYADFLQKDLQGKLEEEQETYLEGLMESVCDGEKFLDDLLALSRIGKKQVKSEKTHVGNFLRNLIDSLHFPPEVEFVMKEDWPTLQLEPTLSRQIFQNLINNGVKFNTSSKKRIELGWQLINNTHYEIYVKDNGIGIESRFFEKIFLPFQQLHSNQEYEGSGIGLATVKKAADLKQWSLRIESESGQGSVFFVKIPITRSDNTGG